MNAVEKAQIWLSPSFDEATRKEVENLIKQSPEALEDAFYTDLEFGTGGMRGIMGVGTNRLNKYTLGRATQGLATYLKEQFSGKISVAIGYDVRKNSDTFAKLVADVLTANGIFVYLFESFRPTPELSFAVRHLGCQAGIVLTASHNPPEYNGYKVYWNDGGQIVPPHDKNIIQKVYATRFEEINFTGDDTKITYIGKDIDEAFIDACLKHAQIHPDKNDLLKIVFTSIHGTSVAITPKAFAKAGFTQFHLLEEQQHPDPNFSTVKSPNPEEPEALSMAIAKANALHADIVIGTDPDADRLGVAARNQKGELQLLNGNQTNTLLTHYILTHKQQTGDLYPTDFIGSTIVTSDIFKILAKNFGIDCKVGLTGFKWIADMIRKAEGKQRFLCGGEESFGFMIGDFVRDKDSISASLLIAEIAAQQKAKGKTLWNYLAEIYTETGFYLEDLISVTKKGKQGAEEIAALMKSYRENPPMEFAGSKVVRVEDYLTSKAKNLTDGSEETIDIPSSNVMIFYTEDGSKIACRPSGTEPKIKYYFSVHAPLARVEDYSSVHELLRAKLETLKTTFSN